MMYTTVVMRMYTTIKMMRALVWLGNLSNYWTAQIRLALLIMMEDYWLMIRLLVLVRKESRLVMVEAV